MLITISSIVLILSLLGLYTINTITIYKLYKEVREYRTSMFVGEEEYEESDKRIQNLVEFMLQDEYEPEYTYDNPPKPVNNLFDVDAYRKRMDAMKKEQDEEGLYEIKEEVITNDTYFTGVEEPED